MNKITLLEAKKLLNSETVVPFKETLVSETILGQGKNRKHVANVTGSGLSTEASITPSGLGAITADESGVISEQRLQFETLEVFFLEGNVQAEGFYSEV